MIDPNDAEKFIQFLNTSKGVEIILAPTSLSSNQVFNYEGKSITALNSCLKGSKLLIFKDARTNKYFCIAEAGSKENGSVISSRTVLSRQTQPNPLNPKKPTDLEYAIGYEVVKEEENAVEFWIATNTFEKIVHKIDYQTQFDPDTPPVDQLVPGYYLAIWAYNYPWEIDDLFFGDTLTVRGAGDNYEFGAFPPTPPMVTTLFGQDFGVSFFFQPYATTKIPKPANFPEPYFNGEYLIPTLRYIPSAFSDDPITHSFNSSLPFDWDVTYPAETNFRTIMYASDDNPRGAGVYQWAIYEYTGVMFTQASDFNNWTDETIPDSIKSKGFVKADLMRPLGQSGQIYAKVHDIPSGPDSVNNSFHLAFALIPWDEEPGDGYPGDNILHYTEGENGFDAIYNNFLFLDPNPPVLVWDGRDYFTPGPNEPQPYFVKNLYEWYVSSKDGNIYFFLKEKNTINNPGLTGGTDSNEFLGFTYKVINKNGNIIELDWRDPDEFVAGRDFPDLNAFLTTPGLFRDWRWFLQDNVSLFTDLAPSDEELNSDLTELLFPKNGDSTKNRISLRYAITEDAFVGDKFFTRFNFSDLITFLNDSSLKEFTATATHTGYTLTYDQVNHSLFDTWATVLETTQPLTTSEVTVTRPSNLTNLINNDPEFKVGFFTPVLSSKKMTEIENLI